METPIIKAIEAAGGQARLAAILQVTPSLVSQWATNRRPVAATHCIAIQRAANNEVTVHDLRPDVFGPNPNLPHHTPPARVPNGEHPVRDANDRDHVLGAGRSK